jgi:rhodanese-related sulfurtransferase
MIRHLTTEQLEDWIERGETPDGADFLLVNVLGEDDFRKAHIPGSRNVPTSRSRLENEIERLAGGKDVPVVVYCAGSDCDASPAAAKRLTLAGFTNVYDYSGGMKSWIEARNDVAGVDGVSTTG